MPNPAKGPPNFSSKIGNKARYYRKHFQQAVLRERKPKKNAKFVFIFKAKYLLCIKNISNILLWIENHAHFPNFFIVAGYNIYSPKYASFCLFLLTASMLNSLYRFDFDFLASRDTLPDNPTEISSRFFFCLLVYHKV